MPRRRRTAAQRVPELGAVEGFGFGEDFEREMLAVFGPPRGVRIARGQEVFRSDIQSPLRLAAEDESQNESTGAAKARRLWRSRARSVPRELRSLINTVDVPMYRVECLDDVEHQLFGWRSRVATDHRVRGAEVALSPVQVRLAYERALEGHRRDRTLQVVRHAVDRTKNAAFVRKLTDEDRAMERPGLPLREDGVLEVYDPKDRARPAHGVRSFLEATAVQVPTYVIDIQVTYGRSAPKAVLDVTGGGGTNRDVVSCFGGSTLELDLAPVSDNCRAIDVRRFKEHVGTQTYDVVFIHPPSIGLPSPVAVADGAWVEADLACCTVEEWVSAVTKAMRDAIDVLRPGHGLLSMVIPEGIRAHQRVFPLPGIADQVIEGLPEDAFVVERLRLKWGHRARQFSLGRARVPSVHLLIAREGPWP